MACPPLSTEAYQLCIEITAEIKLGNDVVSCEITSTAIFNVLRIAHYHFACRFLHCLITTREGSLRETNDEMSFRILCETSRFRTLSLKFFYFSQFTFSSFLKTINQIKARDAQNLFSIKKINITCCNKYV